MSLAITDNHDAIEEAIANAEQAQASCSSRVAGAVLGTAGWAVFGALTAVVISFNPVGGLVFGATNALVNYGTGVVGDQSGFTQSTIGKVATWALSYILGAVAGYGATLAVGIPITVTTAAILTVAPLAVGVTVALIGLACFGGCIGLGVATGAFSTDQLSGWRDDFMNAINGETPTPA